MTAAGLTSLLQEFYREAFNLMLAHQANARRIGAYDANNGYQQVLGRQEVHLRWIADAIEGLGGRVEPPGGTAPAVSDAARGETPGSIVRRDLDAQRAFVERWGPRLPSIGNARHRKMLELTLGEMREHLRLFQQALEGRTDLLGRHADGKELGGSVLPERPGN